jgi:hypothetical protein
MNDRSAPGRPERILSVAFTLSVPLVVRSLCHAINRTGTLYLIKFTE